MKKIEERYLDLRDWMMLFGHMFGFLFQHHGASISSMGNELMGLMVQGDHGIMESWDTERTIKLRLLYGRYR